MTPAIFRVFIVEDFFVGALHEAGHGKGQGCTSPSAHQWVFPHILEEAGNIAPM